MNANSRSPMEQGVLALVAFLHGAVVVQLFAAYVNLPDFAKGEAALQRAVLLLAVFMICQLVILPLWGALSDRVNPRSVLLFSTGAVLVGSLVPLTFVLPMAFPRSIMARLIFGLGAAGMVLALSFAANRFEQSRRLDVVGPLLAAFLMGGGVMMACHWLCYRWGLEPRVVLAASSSLLLVLSIVALTTMSLWLDEPRPKSENYRGINALHHLWHGFGLLRSQAGFSAIMLLIVGGFVGAQALLWVAPMTMLSADGPSGTSVAGLMVWILPWFGAALGAASCRWFAPSSAGLGKLGSLAVGGLLLLVALLAAAWDTGWLVRTLMACAIGYCAAVLTALALAVVISSSRSRVLGAVTGAACTWWMAGFALSAALVLGEVSAESHQALAYALIGAGVLGLALIPFVLRSSSVEMAGQTDPAGNRP